MNKWRNSSGEDSAQHKYGWVWWVICPWGCVFEQPNKSDICTRHWNSTSRNWGYGLSSLADGHSERFTRTIWWPLRSESAVYIAAQTCAWVRKNSLCGSLGQNLEPKSDRSRSKWTSLNGLPFPFWGSPRPFAIDSSRSVEITWNDAPWPLAHAVVISRYQTCIQPAILVAL